ncbi:hypothetical protein [Frankia sp. EI5c]|uniref:hypothetical protein n=1 Tax=Frankia sp. EI5c TaxID=683316 RepID=UPI000A03158A|nr:hypothetical protein [Frankia sp. EI5c]
MTDTPFRIGALTLATDVSPADWVVAGTGSFDYTVGSLVPRGFAAYARVFHPAWQGGEEVSWATVARANGRVDHPSMEWISITGSWRYLQSGQQPGLWDTPPLQGSLPIPQAARLAELLAPHTSTAERCWFAVWEGFGALAVPTDRSPLIPMRHRSMVALTGPLSAVTTSLEEPPWEQLASLWWPEDRAWCVATDVDLMSTYVGGSAECIDALTRDHRIEAVAVPADQRITWDSDGLNPTPARGS